MASETGVRGSSGSLVSKVLRKLRIVFEMIKFEHTIFALPFAYAGAWLASGGTPSLHDLFWVTVAMVGARSCAMALNRVIDMGIDAKNPRTMERALPKGLLKPGFVWWFAGVSAVAFIFAAYMLNPLCLALSPLAVLVLTGYSYTKRFTWLCHIWLGTALSIAPAGAWVAVKGSLGPVPILVAGGVMLWSAGFDIIYACLDVDFDRKNGLFSIPSRFGIPRALTVSKLLYWGAVLSLALAGYLFGAGAVYYCALGVIALFLAYEHRLVHPGNLSRVDLAFATMNGFVSVVYFGAVLIALAID